MLENKTNDVEMGLLNDSTQNLNEQAHNNGDLGSGAKDDFDHSQCEFNIYREIKSSPRKFYCKRFFKLALKISAWTCAMWALTTFVIGKPVEEEIVSV